MIYDIEYTVISINVVRSKLKAYKQERMEGTAYWPIGNVQVCIFAREEFMNLFSSQEAVFVASFHYRVALSFKKSSKI